ncbi:MAG TPA: serine/threonine-protein kinase [Polyangiaceae bacterium]|jgi:serine/threonine-protein kinase|nr:serine/threonine-protein kinase [Polyangiaceae bacterium]
MSDTVVLPSSPVVGQFSGDVIAGKYRLERELGRGAMGTVWAATHLTLGQRVAIKLIAGDQSRSVEARQRFSVEAKAAARLRSRHVVQVYDDGETPDGTPYIVMEYLEGKTLEERLDEQPDIALAEAVRITTHVGRALARAHAQGVVHRDLKSGNIFLAKSDDDELGWVAKVLDFGVAKVLTDVSGPSATKTGTIVGTPLFMSPEQIRGASHVDHRADLYSLGMVFYNVVTRSHAFDGPSYSDVLVAICTEALPDIRVAAPWLPPALSAWFDKACARERDDRFQSADEMIEALQDAAGPAMRLTRPSISEEMSGPSGTLVGHVPPHAAATLLALEAPQLAAVPVPAAPPHVATPERIAGGTLKSGAAPPGRGAPATRARSSDNLVLWGITGVALAFGTMALFVAVSRTRASAPAVARVPASSVSAPVHAAVTVPVATPAPAHAASPAARAASPPAPVAPTPTAATPPPAAPPVSAPRPSDAHRNPPLRRSSSSAPPAATPAPVAARPPAPHPTAGAVAPDMGF